jgi:hypothetical protein
MAGMQQKDTRRRPADGLGRTTQRMSMQRCVCHLSHMSAAPKMYLLGINSVTVSSAVSKMGLEECDIEGCPRRYMVDARLSESAVLSGTSWLIDKLR